MARRLMSRRGNSASQPQVTPYQQLELDDGWREWENTKQELVLVKRQLTEKDALILQLKTASRRLQETLRKKEKDLQAAFAILRSPQDAKTTKTRKQELIDRLVSECMQRATTSEALAEERRRELDRLKYSSKFLRFQELEVEIEECHTEIDRLRAKLETTAVSSPTTIAGKLKISAVPLVTSASGSYTGTLVKKNKLEPLNLQEQESPDSKQNVSIPRMTSTHSATGQVRVVPLAKYDHREGFVSKTRRRALEAEYYKQVRLAQLEVECELEENLHIRAAREAKRLEATELQERRTDFIINSARSQQFTPRNNDPGEQDVQSTDTTNKETKDAVNKVGELPEKYVSEDPAANAPEKDSENDGRCGEAMEVQSEKKTNEDGGSADVTNGRKETDYGSVWNMDPKPHNDPEPYQNDDNCKEGPGTIWNMDPISENKFDPYQHENSGATDDNSKDTNPGSVWNVDPNPESKADSYQSDSKIADVKDSAQDNEEMKSAAWNVDPEPSSVEAGERDPDRVIWNADPNPGDPDPPLDDAPVAYSDDDDDDHEAEEEQNNSVSSDVNNDSMAWNLPLSPSLPTEEKPEDPVVSHEVEADSVKEDSNDDDDNYQKEVWNADPTPASYEHHTATNMEENADVEHLTEVNQPLWNLYPEPAPVLEAVSNSEEIQHTHDNANDEISPEAAGSAAKEAVHADSNSGEDLNTVAVSPSPNTENSDNPWNLEPKVSTSPGNNTDEGQIPVHNDAGELSASTENVQIEADHADIDSDPDRNTVWNLTPSVPDPNLNSEGDNEDDNRNSVWNLDPHTGDASEPPDTSTVVTVSELQTEVAQENEDASTPRSIDKQLQDSLTEDPPAESSSNDDEAPAAYPSEANNPNSPREYEDDATEEYTPPSTARDSDDD